MAFWTVAGILAALTALILCRAAWRGQDGSGPDSSEADGAALYLRRSAEMNRERARGLLEGAALRQGKRRLARQLLRQSPEADMPEPAFTRVVAVSAIVAILGAAVALYAKIGAPGVLDQPVAARYAEAQQLYQSRPDQQALQAVAAKLRPTPPANTKTEALMRDLRATVASRPDDLRGHILLAQSELSLGHYEAAQVVQQQVIALRGTAQDIADLGAIMVTGAGGVVSRTAEAAFDRALGQDPANGTALYYLGLMWAQNGRPDRTVSLWQHMPASSPFLADVRRDMPALATAAGLPLPVLPVHAPSDPALPESRR